MVRERTMRECGAVVYSHHPLALHFLWVVHHHVGVGDVDASRGVDAGCRHQWQLFSTDGFESNELKTYRCRAEEVCCGLQASVGA